MDAQGIVATLNLVMYYNTISKGRFNRIIEFLRYRLNEIQNGEFDTSNINSPFSEEQVRKSGISKEAKIALTVMNYMFNGDFRQNYKTDGTAQDCSIAIFSVLYVEGYWNKSRADFINMIWKLFGFNINSTNMNKFLERNGNDYRNWKKIKVQGVRKEIAEKFSEMILELKKQKMEDLKY